MSRIAKGLTKYKPPSLNLPQKPIHQQNQALAGQGPFHTQSYKFLMQNMVSTNQAYKTISDTTDRKRLATAQVNLWKTYIQQRELPQKFKIKPQILTILEKVWQKMLHRKENTIQGERLVDYHQEFIHHHTFDFQIDDKSLQEMIHPYSGYLSHHPKGLTFKQLIDFYKIQIVASYQRTLGEELLAKQISSFNYWKLVDVELKGWMEISEFSDLLETLRFPYCGSHEQVVENFKWNLETYMKDEFNYGNLYRFNLIRQVFLDFNLQLN